jgi:hypothetical protein
MQIPKSTPLPLFSMAVNLLQRRIIMAKPLGAKSILIREAIKANPKLANKELAEKLMESKDRADDKITVTPSDIAQQKQQMKVAGRNGKAPAPPKVSAPVAKPSPATVSVKGKRGRPRKVAALVKVPAVSSPSTAASVSPVDLIDSVFSLASQCGGVASLKKLVDRLAGM